MMMFQAFLGLRAQSSGVEDVFVCVHTHEILLHLHPLAMLPCIAFLTSYAALDLQLIADASRAFLPSGTSPAKVLTWLKSHAHLEPVTETRQMEHKDQPGLGHMPGLSHMPIPGARVGGPLHPHHKASECGELCSQRKTEKECCCTKRTRRFAIASHSPNL